MSSCLQSLAPDISRLSTVAEGLTLNADNDAISGFAETAGSSF